MRWKNILGDLERNLHPDRDCQCFREEWQVQGEKKKGSGSRQAVGFPFFTFRLYRFPSRSNFDCLGYKDKYLCIYDRLFSKPALLHHLQMQNPNRIAAWFLDLLKRSPGRYQHISCNDYKEVLSVYPAQVPVLIILHLTRPCFQILAWSTKNAVRSSPIPPLELYAFAKR